MIITLAVLAAFGIAAIVYVVARIAWMAWKVLANLHNALLQGIEVLKVLQPDLAVLRQFTAATNPSFEPNAEQRAQVDESTTQRVADIAPFPRAPWDMFPRKEEPIAPVETVDVTATDSELVDEERLSNIRDAGYEPEVDPATPGRTVDAP